MRIEFYDTTLRDGAQSEDMAFSVMDKLRITEKLDEFGMDFVEGGWPGSNPKDLEYFREVKKLALKHSADRGLRQHHQGTKCPSRRRRNHAAAPRGGDRLGHHRGQELGSPREGCPEGEPRHQPEDDRPTIEYLKKQDRTVFFDAEHFFDGYKGNRAYALKVLRAARDAGADVVVLCDTNGGSMPYEVDETVVETAKLASVKLGIHCHNDAETAVANTLMAVKAGAAMSRGP